ncbi:discoidin domain-containing protein [Streptomyces cinereoruber]|uniref:discoidin domain-containing protein n=1 Tax=Streptomyces cinereoruber TaxID=67260 RepID=UPI00363E4626
MSRRNILRGGGSLALLSALGLGAGARVASAASSAAAPAGPIPYSYRPNVVVDASPLPNVAAERPTRASSSLREYTSYNGNDGYDSSRWTPSGSQFPHWWQVDLEGYYDLSGTQIVWPSKGVSYGYRIEVSADGTTWRTPVNRVHDAADTRIRLDAFDVQNVRFIRVTLLNVSSVAALGFCDFKAFGQLHTGSDVALAKIAYASSGAQAEYAIDGSDATQWTADGLHWRVDLLIEHDVTGFEVTWAEDGVRYDYVVEVSADKSVWKAVVDRSVNTARSKVQSALFAESDVRFVRLKMVGVEDGHAPRFSEFKVFATKIDVALDKPASASSNTATAARANDTDHRSGWIAANGDPHWWMVDLGAPHDLDLVRTRWETDEAAYRFTVEASADQQTWTQIVNRSTNDWKSPLYSDAVSATGVRYVRVNFLSAGGWWAGLLACQILGRPSARIDVALNKPASASSNGSAAALANDGDQSSTWIAANGDPHWWMVDLGAPHDLNTIRTRWEANAAYRFTVEASTDQQTWTQIVNRSTNDWKSPLYSDAVSATGVRYVRVNFLSAGGWWAGLRVCEVLGQPSTTEVARAKPMSTNDAKAYGDRAKGNDGSGSTAFEFLGYGDPYVYKVDLLQDFDVSGVEIAWSTFGTREPYTVEVSPDNEHWRSVATATAQGVNTHTVSERTVRFVRLTMPSTHESFRSSIKRLKVLGTLCAPKNLASGRTLSVEDAAVPSWWSVEFVGLTALQSVRITWQDPGIVREYTVEVSSDGHTWVPAVRFRGPASQSGAQQRLRAHHVRFVRVTVPRGAGKAVALDVRGTVTRDETVLELEARKSFDYFWELANTQQGSRGFGLVSEATSRHDPTNPTAPEPTSTSGTGFGLAALVVGAERGWKTRAEAEARALATLNTLLQLEHRFGVLYHYYDRNSGAVWYWEDAGRSEVGLIDTQLMLNGVIVAGEYFGGEVKAKADELYSRINWASFVDASKNQYHMSYFDNIAGFKYHWSFSSEAKLMYVLGAGSPTPGHEVGKEMFYDFERHEAAYGETFPPLINTWFGSLFTYQFAEIFADFRHSKDREGVDWWRNAVLATKTHKEYAAREHKFLTFGPDMWGMSACMTPTGKYSSKVGAPPSGYANASHENDGTVSPDGAGGSLAMDPEAVTRVLNNCYYNYPGTWGTYGFLNALNFEEPDWISDEEFALDKGAALVSIENHRSGLLWRLFMQNGNVLAGLEKCEIKYTANTTPLDVAITEARILLDRMSATTPPGLGIQELSDAIRTAQDARLDAATPEEVTRATTDLKTVTDRFSQ